MGRREEAVKLREAGLSCAEVGRQMGGLSKQRVSQLAKPKRARQARAKPPKVMLRAGEAAQLLGVHTNTVRRWSDQGILRAYLISTRGDRRFRRTEIEGFLRQRRQ